MGHRLWFGAKIQFASELDEIRPLIVAVSFTVVCRGIDSSGANTTASSTLFPLPILSMFLEQGHFAFPLIHKMKKVIIFFIYSSAFLFLRHGD